MTQLPEKLVVAPEALLRDLTLHRKMQTLRPARFFHLRLKDLPDTFYLPGNPPEVILFALSIPPCIE
ncbi:MAG: hypothetical protein ONB44_19490 [candidate division KSB1 bacterium]|nr:hypothetical protein [candidate division KSB1 bacterium]